MKDTLQIGSPPISVNIRRSARARRYSLRISGVDGQVNLTVPHRAPFDEAVAFAHKQEMWIRRHLAKHVAPVVPTLGGQIMLEGVERDILQGRGRRVVVTETGIEVPGRVETMPARLMGFFKTMARDRLSEASAKYAARLERPFGRITIRDTRSRWGSCTQNGDLMYSWRLILAPPDVLDYVAAHEVAHLVEMNHSRAYWDVVDGICPEYRASRVWLQKNGQALHRFRFQA